MIRKATRGAAVKLGSTAVAMGVVAAAASSARAAVVTVTVSPTTITNAYVNVFSTTGGYLYGFPNSLGANPATFTNSNLTLGINSSVTTGGTAPGTVNVSAATYAENPALAGSTVVFNFAVTADTVLAPYTVTGFIGDFAPDFSSSVQQTATITGVGNYSITLATKAGDPIQYGFTVAGPNTTAALAPTFGTVTIAPFTVAVPEPATLGGAGVAAAGLLVRRRRRA